MKIYNVKDIHGNNAKGLIIKIDQKGKVKIVSHKEIEFKEMVRGEKKDKKTSIPSESKRRGRPRKNPIVSPPVAIAIDDTIVSQTNGTHEIILQPIESVEGADVVNVGDKIEFTMNGEPTRGEILEEYPDLQELKVKVGELKVVIPAAWFIRKI